ncbi:cytochrome P450 [Amycolatopsis sp. NBRC 101858]|uniref:cytochrome P450 n=1 Tax=Amycolatopsis sp. NBRC 101858 TaxID=3032200 RepID=UPI0024A49787|nr:cytochrome P450 [Amycolatopsis sp. NBRC 101858]GLY38931.1 cytochrome P450 [Amycolatopsis sp. NBRC 101858]
MTETASGATETAGDLPEFPSSRSRENPFLPPPGLLALHETGESLVRVRQWDGETPWMSTSHEVSRQLLSSDKLSAGISAPGYPITTPSMKAHAPHMEPGLNNTDGAEHTRWRRMLTNSFTRKRMALLRPEIQQMTDELIDRMLEGPNPANLNEAVSLPLPSLMICALLGVPYEDHTFFQKHATVVNSTTKTAEEGAATNKALREYIQGLIEKKMDDPQEDVLTDLGEKIKEGVLAMDEAQRLGLMLLVAGHDTSANMITLGTALLLRNPDQLAALRENAGDERFVANAVEELLRYLTIAHLLARRAVLEDFEIAGVTIRKGDGVIAALPIANHDPEAFPDPARLDLSRRASHHLAFGWGPHQCVGQQLARIELQVAFGSLFTKVPTLSLAADFDSLRFKEDSQAYGIYELPVKW